MTHRTATLGSRVYRVIQVSSGNLFEAFDLVVFGTFATTIGKVFFPSEDPTASLMMTLMVFASAYVMRFAGAMILGPYFDHAGRRKGLIVSLSMMGLGSFLIAATPGYATIGPLAPILIVIGRLIQGFSIGAETGGVNAYLKEIAGKGREALFVCWGSVVFSLATVIALTLGYLLNHYLTPEQLLSWGFRVPFIIGCGIVPLVFYMRTNLIESEEFTAEAHHPTMKEVSAALLKHWPVAISGMFMCSGASSMFYLIFTYSPIFAKEVLKFNATDSLLTTVTVTSINVVLLPLFAMLSDRIGRRPILFTSAILGFLTAYPALRFLSDNVTLVNLISVQLWFTMLYASYAASAFVALTELIPARIRATGYGAATTLGLAIFGGFTPWVSQKLVLVTGDKASPGYLVMFMSVCSIAGVVSLWRLSARLATQDQVKWKVDVSPV